MLPFTLDSITIEAAGPTGATSCPQAATARCSVCGAESETTVDPTSLDHLRHTANNVAKYLCPERGHGHYGYV